VSLDEYRTGAFIDVDFNADQYEDVYDGHVKTLVHIRECNPDGFHRLMANLFKEVMYVKLCTNFLLFFLIAS